MRILAIDTALTGCSVCVWDTDTGAPLSIESEVMDRGHAEALVPMLARVMDGVDGEFGIIDRIAVTVGPGSFTGLRVGLACARSLAIALKKPVIGVTTLSAFAAPHVSAGATLTLASTVDARHGNVFVQVVSPTGRVIVAPRIAKLSEAARLIGGGSVRIVGSAAPLLAREAESLGVQVYSEDSSPVPDITWIARIGMVANPDHAPAMPLYLRDPDAQPQGHVRLPRR